MTITLTNEESLEYFHNALCNGLSWIGNYGLICYTDDDVYAEAKKNWKPNSDSHFDTPCHEDVLIQILRDGGKLQFTIEHEIHDVTLETVYERVSKTPLKHLMDMVQGNDDAITADVIIQTVVFNELIYG